VDGTTWKRWFNGHTYTDTTERLGYAEVAANPQPTHTTQPEHASPGRCG